MVVAYNRPGHGAAGPRPTGPWPVTWMHEQADSLKRLVQALNIERPLIVGHSDGASIALIAAARGLDTVGVLALAPHSFVEPVCVEEISAMRGNRHRIVSALRRHHQHPEALFDAWSGVWTSKDFAMWDIRPELAAIATPCVVVQGDRDEYATDQQLANTVAAINSSPDRTWARAVVWADTGHLVHHDAPERIVMYVQSLLAAAPDR